MSTDFENTANIKSLLGLVSLSTPCKARSMFASVAGATPGTIRDQGLHQTGSAMVAHGTKVGPTHRADEKETWWGPQAQLETQGPFESHTSYPARLIRSGYHDHNHKVDGAFETGCVVHVLTTVLKNPENLEFSAVFVKDAGLHFLGSMPFVMFSVFLRKQLLKLQNTVVFVVCLACVLHAFL